MNWKKETFGSLLAESRIPCENPDIEKRIRVKLNVHGVEKRPVGAEKEGATKQFVRKAGQFIYGKQNFHKGAFGVIPSELDGFETSADIPSFDVREDCLPEWIYYFFKAGNRYLELTEFARGVGSQRIHPKQLQELEIPLPPIDIQRKIINELEIIEKDEISTELTHQLNLVKQLRQAYLREAMQGKLVLQDPNDEYASVLLEKIKAEKDRLIKEKKIKKQKPLPPITEDEIPFEIPENWVWCRLGEITYSISTGPFGTMLHKSDYVKQGIPLVNPMNIIDSKIVPCQKMMVDEKTRQRLKSYILRVGDVVIGRRGEMGRCATVTENEDGWLCGTGSFFINLHFDIHRPFFVQVLSSETSKKYLLGSSVGSTMNNLNHRILNNLPIPLPPLSEQQRIVAKLDELMAYCDNLESSIKASQQQNELLLQQVLREALEPKEKEIEKV